MAETRLELIVRARDLASQAVARVSGSVGELASRIDALNARVEAAQEAMNRWGALESTLRRVAVASGGFLAALGGIIAQGVRTQATFEQLQKRLEVILGEQMGREMFRWAVEFAAKTPYEVGEVIDAVTALASVAQQAGVDLREITKRVGDLAAASGRNIVDIALAVGRAVGGETQSIRELTRGMVAVSLRGLEDIQNKAPAIVQQIMVQSARYQGMMDKMAETTALRWSNLRDAISRLWWALGEIFAPWAKRVIEFLTRIVEKVGEFARTHPQLVKWGAVMAGIAGGIIFATSMTGLLIIAIAKLITALQVLAASWGQVAAAAASAAAAQSAAIATGGGAAGAGILARVGGAIAGAGGALAGIGGAVAIGVGLATLAAGAAGLGTYLGTRHYLAPWTRAQREVAEHQRALQAMSPAERAWRLWGRRPTGGTVQAMPVVIAGDVLPYTYQDEQMAREMQRQFGYGGW